MAITVIVVVAILIGVFIYIGFSRSKDSKRNPTNQPGKNTVDPRQGTRT